MIVFVDLVKKNKFVSDCFARNYLILSFLNDFLKKKVCCMHIYLNPIYLPGEDFRLRTNLNFFNYYLNLYIYYK